MSNMHPWVSHYQPGVPAEIEIPEESLVEMCAAAITAGRDAVALEFFGKKTTYTQLGDAIAQVAAGLKQLGVKAGDRVALVLPNCPQHVIAFYAILRLGAVVVEHNPLYTARELRHLFEDHGATVAIAWDVAVPKLQDQPADIALKHIVSVNLLREFPALKRFALHLPIPKLRAMRKRLSAPAPNTVPWERLRKQAPLATNHPSPKPEDIAALQYTSGTTGRPKGAMLTHRNLYANALQGAAWMHDAVDGEEVIYAVLPMFHAFGMTLYLTFGIYKRARIVLFPTFDVDLVLDAAKKHPPTVYCAVPPIYDKTAQRAAERGISLASAKFCISGAMTLSPEIVERWENIAGGLLVEGYGLTECSPVALGNPFHPSRRTGTIGIPFPSTEMRVVDPEDRSREVGQGDAGELLLRGPQVFQGYWNAPEETAAVLSPDGWLRTGDLVTVDPDGFTTIVDRVKELIITGGFNVAPTEVEAVLRTHPAIDDAAVVGVEQQDGGERVVAAVTARSGEGVDVEELRAWCRERLTPYKVPREIFEVAELPKSLLGKVLRKQVRDQLAQARPD